MVCGACHAYPPADTFPRKYWRTEVERGFKFFETSGQALKAPPIESVIRYYEERAPQQLPEASWPAPSRPLGVRFERVSYPGPDIPDRAAISNVHLVRLPPPGKRDAEAGGIEAVREAAEAAIHLTAGGS